MLKTVQNYKKYQYVVACLWLKKINIFSYSMFIGKLRVRDHTNF